MLRTLAFFDLFDHPLTRYELYAWMQRGQRCSWNAFCEELAVLERAGRVRVSEGMVTLAGRERLVETRQGRHAGIARNMKRAIRAARLLRRVPFVEMVAVCNRLSVGHPHEESDIDVFIVIRDGRLWFGRLLVTAVLQVFRLRRHDGHIAGRVCLSFYLTPRAAPLDAIALHDRDDVYLRYWIAHLVPLFVRSGVMEDFWSANEWAHRAMHQAPAPQPLLRGRTPLLALAAELILGGWIGNLLERASHALQLKRMRGAAHGRDTAVVISDTMLKFHENDRRQWYAEQWEERIHALGI